MKSNLGIVLSILAACAVGRVVLAKHFERDPVDVKKDFLQGVEQGRQASLVDRGLPTFVPENRSDWLNFVALGRLTEAASIAARGWQSKIIVHNGWGNLDAA